VKFVATKKGVTTNFFSLLSFAPVFGSGMGKNQDPGSGINIPDPQHCIQSFNDGMEMTSS
jgi:hypothetical protein